MAENNGIAKMPDYRTIVQKTGAAYIPLVEKQISNGGSVDLYQHLCMENALTMMHETAVGAGLEGISALQKSEIMQILQQVATLRLNAFSRPRECYFQTRKKKQPDGNWTTSIEMGIEGDGNDVILRNFGHGVEEVYPYWDVHVDDEFTYPVHHGIDVEPPTWKRCGTGKYARVVYPVRFTDGTVRYFISERAEVRANLVAHINNNMMNETFGIAESRYKATLQQKHQIDARKSELKALMDGRDIDEILDIPELKPYISPAWMEGSRERMILRKMRNNAVKPIPKDFANELSLSAYLAQGAVIPPNREFMAVLGDQSSGTNIEAPLETIKQALSEVMTQQGGGDINIKFTGDLAQLARVLQPVIEREQHRRGTRLVKGVV